MLGHTSTVLTLDTLFRRFPEDPEMVAADCGLDSRRARPEAASAVRKSGCSERWLCWAMETGASTAADRLRTAYGPGCCTPRPSGPTASA